MGACCHCSNEKALPETVAKDGRETTLDLNGWFSFGLLAMVAGLVMTVTLAVNIDPPGGLARPIVHGALAAVTGGCLTVFGWPVLRNAFRRQISLELLFLVGLSGAFAASLYSTLFAVGHIYYEVVLVLLAIYRLGRLVSARQVSRLKDLSRHIPGLRGRARIIGLEGEETIPIEEVRQGDRVLVEPGETVPIDGVVREGMAYFEELPHTGEPFPVPRSSGDRVLAGTRVLDGEVVLEATAQGSDRQIDRLGRVLQATGYSRTEALAQNILNVFVPAVLAVALLTFAYWLVIAGDLESAIFNALAVTVVACPCGLGLAIPLAVRRGKFQIELLGLAPQTVDFPDRLSRIDTVVFDKTGTLSESHLRLLDLRRRPSAPQELESWLASIQQRSTHPVARPFWNLAPPATLENLAIRPIPARGIEATFSAEDGREYRLTIGNDLFRAEQASEPPAADSPGSRNLSVYLDGRLVADVLLGEDPRGAATSCLRELKKAGLSLVIMTGDSSVPSFFAEEADRVQISMSSAEKGDRIRRLQSEGHRVLYIGDGLNDAEALQAAEASIALSSGGLAASSVAHAVLEHDDLAVLPDALAITASLRRQLQSLLWFVLIYNAIGIALAATGLLHPVMAATLMLASSVSVLWKASISRPSLQEQRK